MIVFLNSTAGCVFLYCREYITSESHLVAVKAIQAVGRIAVRLPDCCEVCVDKLVSLITLTADHVVSEALVALSSKCSNIASNGTFTIDDPYHQSM